MSSHYSDSELESGYYLDFASALVRYRFPAMASLSPVDRVRAALTQGFRLHHFKRTGGLPRVRKVLGILQGIAPQTLLDVGSGRGVFLWPLLDRFPELEVLSIDRKEVAISDIHGAHAGGIERLHAALMDVRQMALPDNAVDVVTFLEVLEHLEEPQKGLAEAVRVAKNFVVVSVPSKEDDNPEHLRVYDRPALQALFASVGVDRVSFDAVLNHTIAVARTA